MYSSVTKSNSILHMKDIGRELPVKSVQWIGEQVNLGSNLHRGKLALDFGIRL